MVDLNIEINEINKLKENGIYDELVYILSEVPLLLNIDDIKKLYHNKSLSFCFKGNREELFNLKNKRDNKFDSVLVIHKYTTSTNVPNEFLDIISSISKNIKNDVTFIPFESIDIANDQIVIIGTSLK